MMKRVVTTCSKTIDTSAYQKQRFLVLVHIGLLSAMSAYIVKIKKIYKENEKNIMSTTTSSITCYSNKSIDNYRIFMKYLDIILYSIIASAFYNLFYLAFVNDFPKSKYTNFWFYFPLFVVGIVCMGYSVDGFIKINSFKGEPIVCQKMFSDFKMFFILSMSLSVAQAAFSMMILFSSFVKYNINV